MWRNVAAHRATGLSFESPPEWRNKRPWSGKDRQQIQMSMLRMTDIQQKPASSPSASADASTLFRRRHKFRMRPTQPRLLVLKAIESLGQDGGKYPDIRRQLESAGTPLAEQTIYRVAREMADAGLLTRCHATDGRIVYRLKSAG